MSVSNTAALPAGRLRPVQSERSDESEHLAGARQVDLSRAARNVHHSLSAQKAVTAHFEKIRAGKANQIAGSKPALEDPHPEPADAAVPVKGDDQQTAPNHSDAKAVQEAPDAPALSAVRDISAEKDAAVTEKVTVHESVAAPNTAAPSDPKTSRLERQRKRQRNTRAAVVAAIALAFVIAIGGGYWLSGTTPGWHANERSGQSYLIMPGTRKRAKGVYTFEDSRYVFDEKGVLVHGWGTYDGHTYYADGEGHLLTGIQNIDGVDYYFDPDTGEFLTGFYDTETGRVCYSETGYPLYGLCTYQDSAYYFNADGILQTGLFDTDDQKARYYAAQDGALQAGWQTVAEEKYYFDPTSYEMRRGAAAIDGKNYCFDEETGALLTDGFVKLESGTYYAGADGACLAGWQELEENQYYFDESGIMATGYRSLDDKLYFFDEEGILQTGFKTLDGALCYFGEDGVIRPVSMEYEGTDHLFDDHGHALEGWQTLAGTTYYYVMGVKQTGEIAIDGAMYNFGSDGILHHGWSGDRYYGSTGYPLTGWQTIDKKLYYFDENGIMARNTTIGAYKIDASGVATKWALGGTTVQSCFNYVRSNMHYVRIDPDTYENMVNYALKYHRGACYHYASLLHYVLTQAGIANTIIWGTNPEGGTHVWNQLANGLIVDSCNNYYMITQDEMRAKGYSW